MAEDLDWSRSSISLVQTTYLLVSALAMPIVGRFADRYDMRWVLAMSLVFASVGIGLIGYLDARWQVFLLYGVIFALGNTGASLIPVGVMINRWFATGRGMANAVVSSGGAVGQLVIIAILASALGSIGWRTSYATLGVLTAVLCLPLVIFGVRSRPAPDQSRDGAPVASSGRSTGLEPYDDSPPLRAVLGAGQFWLCALMFSCCGFLDFFVITHIVAFATDQGMSTVLAGNMLALMGLLALAGVLTSGALADRLGAPRPVILCFILRTSAFASLLLFQSTPMIMFAALLFGFTFMMTAPLTVVFAENIFGSYRVGVVSGIFTTAHHFGGGTGAFMGAAIFDWRGSYDGAFVLAMGVALLAIGTTTLVRERRIDLVRTSPA